LTDIARNHNSKNITSLVLHDMEVFHLKIAIYAC